ncbi:MAG: SBBP repeat-containing protein [Nocardioidaceae bacterium]|nr:SBBP repeat-containing protein [Nocardioidaceae bacterium]
MFSASLRAACAALLAAAVVAAVPPAAALPAGPAVDWTASYDGGIANHDEATDTATGPDGSVAVTGSSVRRAGDRDIVTVVYAPDGTRRWQVRFNGKIPNWPAQATWNDVAQNVAFDAAGNVYVTGWTWRGLDSPGTEEDIVLLKYSPTGTLLWKRLYNGPVNRGDFPTDLEIDDSGNVHIAGYSTGGEIGVRYYYESLALKFNPDGAQQWARRYSFEERGDIADSADLDAAGNFVVSGTSTGYNGGSMQDTFTIKYSPDGAVLWTAPNKQTFDTQRSTWDVTVDPGGDVYVLGTDFRDESTRRDLFLFKYSGTTGHLLWRRWWVGPGYSDDFAHYVSTDAAGNAYVAAERGDLNLPMQSADAVTLKYAPNGTLLWSNLFTGPDCSCTGWDGDPQMEVTSTGVAYIALQSQDAKGRYRFTTLKYSPTGSQVWVKRVPIVGSNDLVRAMSLDPQGNVILAGTRTSGAAGTPDQHFDYLVAKLLIG